VIRGGAHLLISLEMIPYDRGKVLTRSAEPRSYGLERSREGRDAVLLKMQQERRHTGALCGIGYTLLVLRVNITICGFDTNCRY
jgi:hypothetical protein